MWCKMVALAIKEKTLKQNHSQVKLSEYFLIPYFTGSHLYEAFLGIISRSSLYFAILSYMYKL